MVSFLCNGMQYGIAMRNICVRTEPTTEPLRKYEGDVWDRRQESRVNVGELLRFEHMDNGWCYVTTDATEGFAEERGIFACTKRHYERYRRLLEREYQVVIKPGRYKDGQYFRVGTVLPVFGEEPESEERQGAPVFVKQYLPFTERQMRLQMERMLDIPYSWGDERADGMDCSSTVRAFYACFGFFLPRNASEQCKYGEYLATTGGAEYKDLNGVAREEKMKTIREMGMGTMLHMPGHVMLYVGEREGKPLIFHNCDVYNEGEKEVVVRKCVISEFFPKGTGIYLDYITAAWKKVV